LKPEPGDYDIVKHRVSPFYATPLEAILGANGVRRIYICGVSTSGAVLSAAKEGHDRDYEMVVLEDCCCALTEEQHQAVIEQMQRIAVITSSKDVKF
jgi:nicotinamidase-related amidase